MLILINLITIYKITLNIKIHVLQIDFQMAFRLLLSSSKFCFSIRLVFAFANTSDSLKTMGLDSAWCLAAIGFR